MALSTVSVNLVASQNSGVSSDRPERLVPLRDGSFFPSITARSDAFGPRFNSLAMNNVVEKGI